VSVDEWDTGEVPRTDIADPGQKVPVPDKLRVLVILKDVYGLSHEEIAEELGISVSAAKVRLHRGRKRLRDLLYDEDAAGHAGPETNRTDHAV